MNYYIAGQISDHIAETPEHYILVTDCPLARSGFQEYSVSDLPQEGADALGVDLSDPNKMVDLFRPPEEVFSADAIASLEGKPITLDHPSNGEFVDPDNVQMLAYGHVQNIRKGKDALDSGDWPLVGDILITREPVLSRIRNGDRPSLSVGYEYSLAKDNEGNLLQTDIRCNHVALVQRGRAGSSVRIQDSAPQQVLVEDIAVVPKGRAGAEARIADAAPDLSHQAREIQSGRQTAGGGSTGKSKKECKPMSLARIFGLGLKAAAQDAETKPEDLAEMASEFAEDSKKKADDRKADDKKKADDADFELPEEKVEDRRARDRHANDRHATDRRKAMHDALDRMLEEQPEEKKVEDVDLDELKNLVGQFFTEEEGEPTHSQDLEEVPPIEEEEPIVEDEGLEVLSPEEKAETLASDRRARAGDRFLDGTSRVRSSDARQILDTLRRGVARTGDRDLIRTFNGLAARFTRSSKTSSGAYGAFARASGAVRTGDVGPDRYQNRDKTLNRSLSAEDQTKLQEAYNSRRSTNTTEVKK